MHHLPAPCNSNKSSDMNRITSILTLALCLVQSVFAQTTVSGGIYNDATWTLASSPYIVTADIVLFPGKTLTIEPGVEVRVQGNDYPNGRGTTIEIRGRLVAIGTLASPITFKADGIVTDPWTWGGIEIKTFQGGDGDINYVHMYNARIGFRPENNTPRTDTVAFTNCIFSKNGVGIAPLTHSTFTDCVFEDNSLAIGPPGVAYHSMGIYDCDFDRNTTAVGFVYDTLKVNNCNFRNNGVALSSNQDGIGVITNCLFDSNQVAVWGSGYEYASCAFMHNQVAVGNLTKGALRNCTITNNDVGVELYELGTLTDNEISNNGIGVKIWYETVVFTGNRVCSNTQYNVSNQLDRNLSIVGNCFCESDSTVAEALLYDGYDDISRGLFNYALYDSSCTNIVQLVSKVTIPTGITAPLGDEMSAYPNPGTEFLDVRLPEGASGSLSLSNLQGQVLLSQDAAVQTRLDVASLPAGIYLLAYHGADRQVIKWIKR
jgi:Secretion system C-terminal sorting domain